MCKGSPKIYCVFAIIVACQLLIIPTTRAESTSHGAAIASLRAEYTRLRNIDPETDNPIYSDQWEELRKKLVSHIVSASSGPAPADSPRLRLDAVDLHMRLWRVHRSAAYLTQALKILAPLVAEKEPPVHTYHEACLMRGDIEISRGGRATEAREWYKRANEGDSGVRRLATQRLIALELDTFEGFVPAPEIERPRMIRQQEAGLDTARFTVVLDPGHGGDDSGASGPSGLEEKEVTLDIAKRVKAQLEARGDVRVVLTREYDEFVPLARRTAIANRNKGDLFVSIHNNASPSKQLQGLEAYYLDNTDDQASRKLAERENSVVAGGDLDDLSFIVSDLIQSGKLEDSIRLTRVLEDGLKRHVIARYGTSRSLGVKRAPFFVLVGAHMPCSLLELFFIDNSHDAQQLSREDFRATMAQSIAAGISDFLRGGPMPSKTVTVAGRSAADDKTRKDHKGRS